MFLNCSSCFRRDTAHYQELKNCNCSLWFLVAGHYNAIAAGSNQNQRLQLQFLRSWWRAVCRPKTRWAIKKHWNNKFYYTVASCWFFVWDLYSRFFDAVDYRNSTVWTVCEWTVWLEEFVMPEGGQSQQRGLEQSFCLVPLLMNRVVHLYIITIFTSDVAKV